MKWVGPWQGARAARPRQPGETDRALFRANISSGFRVNSALNAELECSLPDIRACAVQISTNAKTVIDKYFQSSKNSGEECFNIMPFVDAILLAIFWMSHV
ncbi:unnamed protein product [Leptosia nina]|uniref:Uncharacterized protein n=1 Tax=Leptosia nina TaxID=320188 RepID=A0AAV1J6J6_9NEOP